MRRAVVGAIAVGLVVAEPLVLIACSLTSDFSGLTSGGTGASLGTGGGGGGCPSPAQCPQPPSSLVCYQAICVDGVCGTGYVAAQQPARLQTIGDCQVELCDGVGGVLEQADDSDTPDAELCWVGTCDAGEPGAQPAAAGAQCNASKCEGDAVSKPDTCDGAGHCTDQGVQDCTPYTCHTDNEGKPECAASCQNEQDCADGFSCSAGICQAG